MKYVRIDADRCVQVTECANTDDPWDRDNTHTYWTFGSLWLDDESSYGESTPVCDDEFKRGDLCYAVVAVWSTGDSFGYDSASCMGLMEVFDNREAAEALKEKYENGSSSELPWGGYFENLDYVKIVHGVLG